MINLNDYIVEVGDEEYVPLKIAQAAVAEAYQFDEYQKKLDAAMNDFKNAMNNINNLTEDIDD